MPREIRTTSRGHRTEFEQSMSGDIIRALVELITNADDSYTRGGTDGPIAVAFGKPGRGSERDISPVSVIDHAEGMTESDMSSAADLGVEASGFAKKKTIRGMLGRGLKQAAFGIGRGADLVSIKKGILSFGRLYDGEHRECMFATGAEFAAAFREADCSPRIPTTEDRESLGLPADGTRITLRASKDLWTVNQHQDAIRERLETHYALRGLLKNSTNRPVFFIDRHGTRHTLGYTNPKASPEKPVVSTYLTFDGFPDARAHLKIYRTSADLGPVDEYSESGVIVYSDGVPLTQTFFGREGHPLAGRFYGRLKCDYIAEILRRENAKGSIKLITLQRLGFVPNHAFTKAMIKAARPHIDKLLQQESDREKQQKADDQDQGLKKSLDKLVPELNRLMASLLNPLKDTEGIVRSPEGIEPNFEGQPEPYYQPLDDLEFHPEEIGVRAHAEKQTALFIRDAAFSDKQRLQVTIEGEGLRVVTSDLHVDHARSSKNEKDGPIGYSKLPFKVEGTQAGTNAIVHVRVGRAEAMLLVTVGGYKEPQPPKPKPKGAILKEITIGEFDGKFRAHFDVVTGLLKVNAAHPLLKYYAELRHEKDRGARRPWATAVADAMTEALVRVVISNFIEEKGTIPRNSGWDKTMKELDALWYSLGTAVHKAIEDKLLGART